MKLPKNWNGISPDAIKKMGGDVDDIALVSRSDQLIQVSRDIYRHIRFRKGVDAITWETSFLRQCIHFSAKACIDCALTKYFSANS